MIVKFEISGLKLYMAWWGFPTNWSIKLGPHENHQKFKNPYNFNKINKWRSVTSGEKKIIITCLFSYHLSLLKSPIF